MANDGQGGAGLFTNICGIFDKKGPRKIEYPIQNHIKEIHRNEERGPEGNSGQNN